MRRGRQQVVLPTIHSSTFKDPVIKGASVTMGYTPAYLLPDAFGLTDKEVSEWDEQSEQLDALKASITGINPRATLHESRLRKAILNTFVSSPEEKPGHMSNKGLMVLADSVSHSGATLKLEFDIAACDRGEQGIGDGLTTASTVVKHRNEIHPEQLLFVQIYSGYTVEQVKDAVLHRNSGKKLCLRTQQTYVGKLDLIRDFAVAAKTNAVSFVEGDGGEIDAGVLVQHLGMAHPSLSQGEGEYRISNRWYNSHVTAHRLLESNHPAFEQYTADVVRDILKLSDFVQELLHPRGNEISLQELVKRRGEKRCEKIELAKRYYPNDNIVHSLGKGYHFPIFASACRLAVGLRGERVALKMPLKDLFDHLESKRTRIRNYIKKSKKRSDPFGKDRLCWFEIDTIVQG